VDLIEVDVRRSRDGHLVLIHDDTVERTTKGWQDRVADMTLSQLRHLDAGDGERIPMLDELLRAARWQAGLMLEIKAAGLGKQAQEVVTQSRFSGTVTYAPFLPREVRTIRKHDPSAVTWLLFGDLFPNPVAEAQLVMATHVGFKWKTVTPSLLLACHDASLIVFIYTVNELRDIANMRAPGVDGIISDFPDKL
jgi:glycerophosphoryl diester phosphodiesterase